MKIVQKRLSQKLQQQQQYVTKTEKNIPKIKYVQVSQQLSIIALLKSNLTTGGFAELAQAFF